MNYHMLINVLLPRFQDNGRPMYILDKFHIVCILLQPFEVFGPVQPVLFKAYLVKYSNECKPY
jgi:hypothetical protein